MVKNGSNWVNTGQHWFKLVKTGQNGSKQIKMGQSDEGTKGGGGRPQGVQIHNSQGDWPTEDDLENKLPGKGMYITTHI